MVSITVPLDRSFKERLDKFSWINWSEVGREETLKKDIFDRYIKTGEVTDEDWEFCEKIDWHPVDELPLKEEFKKKLEARRKEIPLKFETVDEFFKSIK